MRSRWLAAAILLQLSIPLFALANAPSQFGFQMYSGAGWTEVTVDHEDGSTRRPSVSDYVALNRIDVDWTQLLPEHICRVEPTAVAVTVERWRSSRRLQCP